MPVIGVHDHEVAPLGVPGEPRIRATVAVHVHVLQQRQRASGDGDRVARFLSPFVDRQNTDLQLRMAGGELVLNLVEVAELATAVTSRRMDEVPGRHLAHIGSRRDRAARVGRRIDVG